jgi:hypothetical protein
VALDVIALNVRRQLSGHRHHSTFRQREYYRHRKAIHHGDVKLTDIPSSPSLSSNLARGIWPFFTISSNVLGDTQM